VVGPNHLRAVSEVGCFDYTGFVQVPYHNAFFQRDRIVEEALQYPPDTLYSVHAGPPSPVIAWMIWQERGQTATILDLGSILDGYTHANYGGTVQSRAALTRSFWRRRATMDILRRNLEG